MCLLNLNQELGRGEIGESDLVKDEPQLCSDLPLERGLLRSKEVTGLKEFGGKVQTKLMKGLLDLIVLQFLKTRPMHGYQIITRIRKEFGVYFGPSTIYPLLNGLEKKGYVMSEWDMSNERPRKVYRLTTEGQRLLNFTQDSVNLICRKQALEAEVITATPVLAQE